jgi:GNAT superfamily N-acetyltransferase
MRKTLTLAGAQDAPAIAALQNAAAAELTRRFGYGRWSSVATERSVRFYMRQASVYIARDRRRIVATLTLTKKKPWAIDRKRLTPVKRPFYLIGMAVDPARQRAGVGRACIEAAIKIVKKCSADSLCLDAHDADAGAGDFYRKCGFTEVGRADYKGAALIYFEFLV